MYSQNKKFIINAVIIPIVMAVIVTGVFFFLCHEILNGMVFKQEAFSLSDYSVNQLTSAPQLELSGNTISKGELSKISGNTVIGSAVIDEQTMEIVVDANEVNSAGRLNMSSDVFVGENGTCFLYCNKKDNKNIRLMDKNDTLEITTIYGSYLFEVARIVNCDSDISLKNIADDIPRGLVIYTDSNTNIGFDNKYCAVVFRMLEGTEVVQ